MKTIIENVILSGRYELSDMLKKIDTAWVQGDLADDDRTYLVNLAQDHAAPENSYAPVQEQITNLAEKISNLERRVSEIEAGEPEEPPVTDEYPPYTQPTGAHDAYNIGSKMTYNGTRYICKINGCVWPPDVYPQGWEAVS